MLDRWTMPLTHRPLEQLAQQLKGRLTPDQITFGAFLMGITALPLLAWEHYSLALVAVLLNRLGDGLDGALARVNGQTSEAGGFLDIGLDFVFYAAVVLGFALANPMDNALAAALLLFAFIGTGTSFLAFAIAAKQQGVERPDFPQKAFYYLEGLTEGTETVLALVMFCLFPDHFPILATVFAIACLITTATRLWGGYWTLRKRSANEYSAR
ncbi:MULTISPECIES: CDP-alcohol phosphatidyltransferase family protein [unclassified Halomonas]|uniref:CDP-alcohol phosphatidyltransferase family protein n=1 Tax=unclassified Halomonas TaxID=2609666 RepID=UPI0006DB45B6|nr:MULTISPECIES: CDP-alcohol phosphatidyltransferase family protein [unclassified Halomonas]KPQ30235.1 MAG: Phosphatidylglycerophosphate synthase [Halomonas sp. HL-93]SBR50743.1 Phosphatidylglycerophosphate synthase [Halomonas sp. HL-93]SNY97013.1 Phosphatidylglycerophosphate synthase [Halomonas sp. hl-4]